MVDDLKNAAVELTGLSRDALHIHVALTLMAVMYGCGFRGRRVFWPWFVVLLAALTNEFLDLKLLAGSWAASHWGDSIHDILNTMLWPTLILAAAWGGVIGGHRRCDVSNRTRDGASQERVWRS